MKNFLSKNEKWVWTECTMDRQQSHNEPFQSEMVNDHSSKTWRRDEEKNWSEVKKRERKMLMAKERTLKPKPMHTPQQMKNDWMGNLKSEASSKLQTASIGSYKLLMYSGATTVYIPEFLSIICINILRSLSRSHTHTTNIHKRFSILWCG